MAGRGDIDGGCPQDDEHGVVRIVDGQLEHARTAVFAAFRRLQRHGVEWSEDPAARMAPAMRAPDGEAPLLRDAGGAGLRLVVVDDAPAMRHLVRALVQLDGHHVVGEAGDGAEALELLRSTPCDAVIIDHVMPGIDGVAAARELTRRPDPPCVIGLSSHEPEASRAAMLAAGAHAWFPKTNLEHLRAYLRSLAEARAAAR